MQAGGFLVLGKVESLLGKSREMFAPVSFGERIYRRVWRPCKPQQISRGTNRKDNAAPLMERGMTPGTARRALREDHLGASTFVEKGWNLIAIGNFSGAEAVLIRALELAPSDVRGRALLGWARMRQGMYDSARKILTGLLAEDSLHAMARVNLGYVCMRQGDTDRAVELLEHSSRQTRDPKAALYASFYLGLLFAGEENFPAAEHCFRRAIFLAPNFIEGYYELGRAQLSAGRTEDARATWKSGHSANRFNIWGKRCAEALRLADHGQQAPSYS